MTAVQVNGKWFRSMLVCGRALLLFLLLLRNGAVIIIMIIIVLVVRILIVLSTESFGVRAAQRSGVAEVISGG